MVNIQDIKSGDIVIENGKRRLVIDRDGRLIIVAFGRDDTWGPLSNRISGITEVYRPRYNSALVHGMGDINLDGNFDFERIHSEVTELTLQQIADKIGIDVDKLRIKE